MAREEKNTFDYIAKNKDGRVVEGRIKATSEEVVLRWIKDLEYIPINVSKVQTRGLNAELSFGKGRRVKVKDLSIWARNFSTMFDGGLPVVRILTILSEQSANQRLREATADVKKDVEGGLQLGDAMSQYSEIFPDMMTNMIRAGEAGGSLDITLKELAKTLEADVRLRSKIKSAMTYPIVVFVLAIVMCISMLLFIVPTFSAMFESLGGELPLPTQILVVLSNFLKVGFIPLAIVAIIGVFWWKKNKTQPYVRNVMDPFKLKIPVFGKLFQMVAIARFTRNLGTLLGSGVPIVSALDITSDTVGNVVLSSAIQDVKRSVRQGKTMAGPLREHPIFPEMTVSMVEVGEQSGNIEGMLGKIADNYNEEIETMTESLTSLIEPLMIVFLGVIVGSMIIALYLPILTISDMIQ